MARPRTRTGRSISAYVNEATYRRIEAESYRLWCAGGAGLVPTLSDGIRSLLHADNDYPSFPCPHCRMGPHGAPFCFTTGKPYGSEGGGS